MKADKSKWVSKTTTSRKEYKIYTNPKTFDQYYDECWRYYKQDEWKKNRKRRILSYQVRMYRNWKHNRKTQWKE